MLTGLPLLRACYRQARGVVASSAGVAGDALELLELAPAAVHVVHNPVQLGPLDAAGDGPPGGARGGGGQRCSPQHAQPLLPEGVTSSAAD